MVADLLHRLCQPDPLKQWRVELPADCRGALNGSYGLAAGVAVATAARPAAQRAWECLLVPCKADAVAAPAFRSEAGLWTKGGSCPVGFSNVHSLKVYPTIALPSTLSLLTPQKLAWLFLKNSGLVFLLQTNLWLYQALDAEEQALQQVCAPGPGQQPQPLTMTRRGELLLRGTQAQLPPFPDVLQQLVKAAWNSLRELLTALTRSEIKHTIQRRASRRTAWKVLKDPRESLARKALWYSRTPAWQLLPLYVSTMLRTQLPMYAAELIVACCYDAADELRRLLYPPPKQLPAAAAAERLLGVESLEQQEQHAPRLSLAALQAQLQALLVRPDVSHVTAKLLQDCFQRWLLRAGKNLARVSGTAAAAALGAGLAAAAAPRDRAGVWAVRGHIVSDLVFANLLLLVLDGGLAQVFGPPPSDTGRHGPPHPPLFDLHSG